MTDVNLANQQLHVPPGWQFWHHLHMPHTTARGVSIIAAVIVDFVLLVLLLPMHDYEPKTQFTAEIFWVIFFIGFTAYVVLQQWTLSKQTGTGQETEAGWDKIAAISPAGVVILGLVVWATAMWFVGGSLQLTWRHGVVCPAFALFGVVDYFTTDITNMRLRSLQLQSRPAGT